MLHNVLLKQIFSITLHKINILTIYMVPFILSCFIMKSNFGFKTLNYLAYYKSEDLFWCTGVHID